MNLALIGHAGFTEELLAKAQEPFLIAGDGPIIDAFRQQFPHAKQFDVKRHSFDPLTNITVTGARAFADALYPEKDLMTYRNGKRALAILFRQGGRLDKLPHINHSGDQEAHETITDLLLSPDMRNVLCGHGGFFEIKRTIIANLDRTNLGDDAARILGTALVFAYKGQIILPDFPMFARDQYVSLIRQDRLICGLSSLSDVSDTLHRAVLKMPKSIYKVSKPDAKELIVYTKHTNADILVRQSGNESEPGD